MIRVGLMRDPGARDVPEKKRATAVGDHSDLLEAIKSHEALPAVNITIGG